MDYNRLGRTGIEVSRMLFGCGNVGGALCSRDREKGVEVVKRALDFGINWFDTAPLYGNGLSEKNLGFALRKLGATPLISTKVRLPGTSTPNIRTFIRTSCNESLDRLGMETVDFLLLHNPIDDPEKPDSVSLAMIEEKNGIADTFESLRKEGLIRYCGFTAIGDTHSLHTVVKSGRFDFLQVYYNVLNPSAGMTVPTSFSAQDYQNLIEKAEENDLGIVAIRVLAAGMLAGHSLESSFPTLSAGSDPASEEQRIKVVKDRFLLRSNRDLVSFALRFVLSNKKVDCFPIGFSTPDHIDAAVRVLTETPLSEEEMKQLHELYSTGLF